ncbi:YihY/virulence factor BrkB family protein [Aeromicrobium sp. Leaf350]|uniref:YihY/virulence factor BrkB family protein n=1 Tax=Aeromicrobium sp. Leaf350 TaxID=2876565 RepID=UPI001E62A83A|nr:YihY/virulence factor BrkB family protein [Aeromicrobium sp. Leaf350]
MASTAKTLGGLTLAGIAVAVGARRLHRTEPPTPTEPERDLVSAEQRADAAPAPDAPAKPDSPDDLTKPAWTYVLRRTAREFSRDQCTDLAAALTYYAVLALFPAAIALLSLVGVVGQGAETVRTLMDVLRDLGAGGIADTLEPTLTEMTNTPGLGLALVIGLLAALWSASGYVGAFGRGMNRIYEIEEGRPIWKLRPVMLLVTLITVLLAALVAMSLVLTGPAAEAVGDVIGLGSTAVLAWNVAKWPVMLAVVVLIVAMLYYATPNVQQPRFRWISVGALLAIGVWGAASALFGFYVGNFSSYDKTYGSLAGVVVFLLWLWITNLALLFGAELDAELERGRELQAGLPAEETIQLPPRDTRQIAKSAEKQQDDIERGRRLRLSRGAEQAPDDDEEGSS